MPIAEAVALAEKGILTDAAGDVAGDKFYMPVGDAGFIKPFSGYLAGEELAYVKTFSFFEGNRAQGLPVTDSLVLLFEAEGGLPVCLMAADWITSQKTGASTAVTAKYLARTDSRVVTIFGAGGLGRSHLLAVNELFELTEARIVDIVPEAAECFAAEMSAQIDLPVTVAINPQEAVRGADIVITVTTGSAVNVRHEWLKPGVFVARMGSYQEVARELLLQADKLIVDRWAYVSYRVPEMIDLIDRGQLSRADIHAEWPDIAGGRVAGRESDQEIILYIALGIWGEYAAILPQVYRRAKEKGLGVLLPS
jgi:ornithine cyclodeaminase/alanine dehydrogenase-like protein (mu-crystallin family)